MAFLRRTPTSERRIADFWDWWTSAGARSCAAAIEGGDPHRVTEDISRHVDALHAGLAWEFAPGDVSEHVLVVTAEGDAALRGLARQWLLAAPAADVAWSYSDLRPPARDVEGIVLSAEDSPDIAFGKVAVSARPRGTFFDVVVHHPAFPELPQGACHRIAFLALDAALGEAAVECWIGAVETSTMAPPEGVGLAALATAVHDHAREYVDADGNPGWQLLETAHDGARGLASTVVPLDPLLAPDLTVHVGVAVEYADRTDEGLPGPGSLHRLRDLEQRLAVVLGLDGMVVAHETDSGLRVLHAYARPGPTASRRTLAAELSWSEGPLRVSVEDDPGWQAVRHLRA